MLYIIYAIILASLIIATVTDIRKREIPLWLFPIVIAVSTIINTVYIVHDGTYLDIIMLVAGFLIFGIAAYILARKEKLGGGDVLMIATLGGSLGFIRAAETILISCVIGVIFILITKKRSIPYAPLLLIGFIIDMILGFTIGYL